MADAEQRRIPLGEAAYRQLRDDIVTCRRPPGQRLTERAIAAETGLGISPLREALTRLDHEGLVRTLPRKGYQVTPLTPKSIDDLFDVWSLVGPELVRRAVADGDDQHRERAREGFLTMARWREGGLSPDTMASYVGLVAETFDVLAEATANEYLIHLYRRLSGEMSRIWITVATIHPGAVELDPPEHWADHILAERDAEAAAEAARAHIAGMHREVLDLVTRWPSVMASEVATLTPAGTPL